MTQVENSINTILPKVVISLKDINYGMILVSIYMLIEIGSFRVFNIVSQLELPFVISALTMVYAVYLIIMGRVDFSSTHTKVFVGLIAYIIIYSQLDTLHPLYKLDFLKLFLQYFANYIIFVTCVKKPQQYMFMIDVFLFSILHSSYHVIYQGGRVWGTLWLRGENNVGLVCAYAMPFAFFLYINYKESIKKYFYLLCMFASVTGIIMANSRGGFVAFAVGAFLCWFFIAKKIRVLVLVFMASLVVIQMAPESFFAELKTLEQGTKEGTADERVYSWGLAVDMFTDHPVLGVGPANYSEYFLEYDARVEGRFGVNASGRNVFRKRVAHSTQFQWLAEFGTVGVIIFLYYQLQLYRNWKVIRIFKIPDKLAHPGNVILLKTMIHANLITQIVFWVGALFISILHYPFYWLLPAFSEVWKNIYLNYVNENEEPENGRRHVDYGGGSKVKTRRG